MADGRKYIGEYKDGMPDGEGTKTWPDGRKYIGEYKDGLFHGFGSATRNNGKYMVNLKMVSHTDKGPLFL